MKKCEWKARQIGNRPATWIFEPCDNFDGIVHYQDMHTYPRYICKHCGVDIRKPQPAEPLIVKSGETWVAYWESVDYLYMQQNNSYECPLVLCDGSIHPLWKSFTGPNPDIIELTDEIAKLRPMVWNSIRVKPAKLVYVDCGALLLIDEKHGHYYANNFRLATVEEFQEAE